MPGPGGEAGSGRPVVLDTGAGIPPSEVLADVLTRIGGETRLGALRAFLAIHPDQLEARTTYLESLRQVAEHRTLKVLGLKASRGDEGPSRGPGFFRAFNPFEALPDPAKVLKDAQDILIWGTYAQEVDSLFRSGDWIATGLGIATFGSQPLEAASPTMKWLFGRHMAEVEEALAAFPGDTGLWRTWAWMAAVMGDRSPVSLAQRLFPTPGHEGDFPPEAAIQAVLHHARKHGQDWGTVKDWLMVEWSRIPSGKSRLTSLYSGIQNPGGNRAQMRLDGHWDAFLAPLLEACLRSNDGVSAEDVLSAALSLPGSERLSANAMALAKACGRPDLARRWSALKPRPLPNPNAQTLAYQGLLKDLELHPPASMVVLDPGQAGWESSLQNLVQQDALVALGLAVTMPRGSSGEALRVRENWPSGKPHWALMDTQGRVLAEGERLPSADGVAKAFKDAAMKPRVDTLRDFIKEHPDQQDARLELLDELKLGGDRRTATALGSEGPRELETAQDEALWGEYARALQDVFQSGAWRTPSGYNAHSGAFTSPWMIHSPTLKRLCARWLPEVEGALAKQPASPRLWRIWLAFHRVAGGGPLRQLLDALVPDPTAAKAPWPPFMVRDEYLKECRERGAWKEAEDLLKPIWEDVQAAMDPSGHQGGYGPGGLPPGNPGWESIGQPLLEVYLQEHDELAADTLLVDWLALGGWDGAPAQAAGLADQLGFPALAARWKALGE